MRAVVVREHSSALYSSRVIPELVAFDLDDTLAPSKTRLPQEMARIIVRLLDRTSVCVISGGQFGQFRTQVVEALVDAPRLDRLHLLPACGTQYYRCVDGEWQRIYVEALTDDEKSRAMEAVETCARDLGLWEEHTWGPVLEDRESQITFFPHWVSRPPSTRRKRGIPAATRSLNCVRRLLGSSLILRCALGGLPPWISLELVETSPSV
ncbi:fructose-bisphosphate aldolase [Cutibacterium acnes JCM 18916]|nr:fructose-bisphosphate aldolase [Cutibacterium acnes JCM 18916]